jgi:ribonuclease P protein component
MTAPLGESRKLRRLTKRSEFLRAARGKRTGRSGFSLQAVASEGADPGIGFTVTKAMGNSPERNRIKRRLREAARACAPAFQAQHDYVLVGRRETLNEPFARLVSNLGAAIARLHSTPARPDSETQ